MQYCVRLFCNRGLFACCAYKSLNDEPNSQPTALSSTTINQKLLRPIKSIRPNCPARADPTPATVAAPLSQHRLNCSVCACTQWLGCLRSGKHSYVSLALAHICSIRCRRRARIDSFDWQAIYKAKCACAPRVAAPFAWDRCGPHLEAESNQLEIGNSPISLLCTGLNVNDAAI